MTFTAENTGELIDGVRLHYVAINPNVIGKEAVSKFVKRHVFNQFGISLHDLEKLCGKDMTFSFNHKGQLVGLAA
jgi:hypothetical protein